MIYGYARVSSAGQAIDGNSLESQEEALKAAGATKIFKEVYTGTKMERKVSDTSAVNTIISCQRASLLSGFRGR